MGILESYVLGEIDNDIEYVAMQVGLETSKRC